VTATLYRQALWPTTDGDLPHRSYWAYRDRPRSISVNSITVSDGSGLGERSPIRRSVADADSDPNPAVPRRTDRSGVGDRLAGVERAVLFCRIQASVGSRARSHDTDGRLWCANGATVEDVAHPLWRPVGV